MRNRRDITGIYVETGYARGAAMSPRKRRSADMKSRRGIVWSVLVVSMLLSGAVGANGGCLQGTWQYFDAGGRLVGEQTVGCGDLDGSWGSATANKTFTPGCASSF
jgi:hypothetical protein